MLHKVDRERSSVVTVSYTHLWYHEGDFHFPVLSAEREKLQGTLDLAVATMWNTAEFVEQMCIRDRHLSMRGASFYRRRRVH